MYKDSIVVSHAIAWAAITTSVHSGFLRPSKLRRGIAAPRFIIFLKRISRSCEISHLLMKTNILYLLGLVMFFLSACSDDNEQATVAVTNVTISPTSISLECGETYQLMVDISPQDATEQNVSWSSSDAQIATVSDDGIVTGIGKGNATITASVGGKSAVCNVTVTLDVQSVSISPTTLVMTKLGETAQLTATVQPEGAGEAVWSSSDEAVATVSSEGLVAAVGRGTATITATAGEKTATCEVTVEISIVEVEDGQATVQLDGGSQEELTEAVSKAAQEGATRFVLIGDYSGLGRWTTNIFNGVKAEVIDLSGVTGWPMNEDGLASVDANTFYTYKGPDFTGIQKIVLPEEVQAIGGYAFYKCTGLKSVIAPGVQVLDQGAFSNCSSLTEVEMPDVRKVGVAAFSLCSQLTEVNMPELTEIGRSGFSYTSLTKVDFPNVTTVGGAAFSTCEQLTEANLPKATNLGEIADEEATSRTEASAFGFCSKLEKVSLPEVRTVGDMAFNGCKALKEIELPEATEIGLSALMNCSSLVSARLPKATYFGRDVFTGCEALSQLYLLAEGGISVKNTTFGAADSITKNVDLTLNADKKEEAWSEFWNEYQWKNHKWKSTTFIEN